MITFISALQVRPPTALKRVGGRSLLVLIVLIVLENLALLKQRICGVCEEKTIVDIRQIHCQPTSNPLSTYVKPIADLRRF